MWAFASRENGALLEIGGNASVHDYVHANLKCFCKKHTSEAYANYEAKPSNVYGTSTPAVKSTKLSMKVQKAGFQNREDDALLEKGGSASVRYWYTRTVLSKFASYSMPTTLR